MAVFRRSGTVMDDAAAFFPQSFAGLRGLRRLGDAGEFGDDFSAPANSFDPAAYYGTDSGNAFPPEYNYNPNAYPPSAPSAIPAVGPDAAAWSWQGIFDKATSAGRDLLLSNNPNDAAQKLAELNRARAASGLPPLPPGAVPVTKARPAAAQAGGSTMLVIAGSLLGGLLFSRAKRSSRRRR